MFDRFPYKKVEGQSFSLVYSHEDKRYAYLSSLDLICDHPINYDLWIKELKSKIKVQQQSEHSMLTNQAKDTTDATLLWLKQIWSCKSEMNEMAESTATKMVRKFNPSVTEQFAKKIVGHVHQFRVESSHGLSLDFSGFVLLFNLLIENYEEFNTLQSIFEEYAKTYPHLGMTTQEFKEFLINECYWQRDKCTRKNLHKLMKSHDSYHQAYKKYCANNNGPDFATGSKLLSYAGFLSFLRSKDNSAIDPEHETVYQDMTQPLSHYFINSSHNTYLEGDQLRGRSSTEAYIRAFLQGCRCVEIDCWDDTLNVSKLKVREPIIYHGFTLTTKIPFRDVVHAIKDYGFSCTKYPIIISIENHCNKEHQEKMAMIFRAIFDKMLPDKDLVEAESRERLPSPKELQEKIILKGSCQKVVKKTGARHQMLTKLTTSTSVPTSPTDSLTPTSPTESLSPQQTLMDIEEEDIDLVNKVTSSKDTKSSDITNLDLSSQEEESGERGSTTLDSDDECSHTYYRSDRFTQKRKNLEEIQRIVVKKEKDQDDQELEFTHIVEDLKSLIIYAKVISIKPWDWDKQRATSVTQMFSFGEPKAVELCIKSAKDMLACTERQLVRTYPKGTRFDSSNYYPLPMWICGIQMVSLNFQYPDRYMHLNQGFFRQNGGCGYVLKPAVMRRENPGGGSTPFDPEMQEPHPDVSVIELEIELLSGQRLCHWKKKHSSVTTYIETYGITHDNTDCDQIVKATHINFIWPHWKRGKHILKKTLYMAELCLVYFRVEADRKVVGQNCFPVVSLQPGIKFIPLRTPGGELIPGSGLFVKIKKTDATSESTESKEWTLSGEVQNEKTHPAPVQRHISKQVSFNLDDGVVEDSNHDTKEEEEGGDNNSEAESFNTGDSEVDKNDIEYLERPDRTRRSSCPASFKSGSSNQRLLTTVAEVHADATDS